MNEFGIGFLCPTPRSCIDLIAPWADFVLEAVAGGDASAKHILNPKGAQRSPN